MPGAPHFLAHPARRPRGRRREDPDPADAPGLHPGGPARRAGGAGAAPPLHGQSREGPGRLAPGPARIQPGQMDVLMVAAPKSLVNAQVKAVKMANLVPVIVDVAPLSAVNCYTFSDEAVTSAVLLAVDASSAVITIVDNGLLRFTRHVEMDFSAQSDGSELTRVLYETTDRLLESDLPQDVEKVYLYGSMPQLATLKKESVREMDLDVELLNPFGNITVPSKLMTLENQSLIGPQSTIGVGLALRKGIS